MADNITLDPGSGGATLAADDIASVFYQRVKVTHGGDGSATDTSTAAPFPVRLSDGTDQVNIDGSGNLNVILAANSGVDIGDVDVLSVLPGTGATNLGKAEDAAHATGDVGVQMLAVRTASPADRSDTDGDYEPLQMDNGRLWASVVIDTAIPAGDNNIGNVDIVTVPAPLSTTGAGTEATALRVTIATDSTGVISVDDNGGALTVDNGGTFVVQEDGAALTALQLIDDIVYTDDTSTHATGTSKGALLMAAATPTDTVVDANDIGAVAMSLDRRLLVDADITASVALDVSAAVVSVDWNGTAPPIGAGTEAAALRVTLATDSTGVVSVDDNGGALTVDNGGAFAVQEDGAALTALQLIDDVVYTDDTSTHATGTSKGALMMAAATPTDGAVDANDIGAVAMSLDRRLLVDAQIAGQDADVTIADGGNAITVDWNGTAPPIGAGTEATALRVTIATDSTGVISVDDNGGALTVDGDVAHDTADSGNPVKIGAVARTADPTSVGGGDRVNVYADDLGKLVNYPYAPRDLTVHNRLALTSGTETTLIALDASNFHDLVALYLSNESASEVRVDIRDATAGTIRLSIDLAADGGGAVIPFPVPLKQAAANNNWTAQLSTAVSTVYVTGLAIKNAA